MDYREANNRDRQIEYRAFLSMSDYVEDDERLYFANTNYNALVIVDKATWTVEQIIPFEGEERAAKNLHLRCVKKAGKICFLPAEAQHIHIYDIENGKQSVYSILDKDSTMKARGAWNYFAYGGQIYLLPGCACQRLHQWDVQADSIIMKDWWDISQADAALGHDAMDEERFFSYVKESNQLYITDLSKQTLEEFLLPDEHIKYVTYDGQNFWYVTTDTADIVCWNREQGEINRYQIQGDVQWEYKLTICVGIYYAEENLFLLFYNNQLAYSLCVLDKVGRRIKCIYSIDCKRGEFLAAEMEPNVKKVGNELLYLLKNAGEVICADMNTLECGQYVEDFRSDDQERKYVYNVLMDRGALLYEEPGKVNLNTLLRYCIDCNEET